MYRGVDSNQSNESDVFSFPKVQLSFTQDRFHHRWRYSTLFGLYGPDKREVTDLIRARKERQMEQTPYFPLMEKVTINERAISEWWMLCSICLASWATTCSVLYICKTKSLEWKSVGEEKSTCGLTREERSVCRSSEVERLSMDKARTTSKGHGTGSPDHIERTRAEPGETGR